MIKKLLSLILAFGLCACHGSKEGDSTISGDSLASTVYKGTLPCGDCPGIETSLTLLEGGQARYATYYIGEAGSYIEEKGTYTLVDSVLSLETPSTTLQFRVDGESLLCLDDEGNPYEEDLAAYYTLYKRRAFDYAGEYMIETDIEEGSYEQSLSITPEGEGYRVRFTASLVKDKPGCSFEAVGELRGDTLVIPLGAPHEGIEMCISPRHDDLGLEVYTAKGEDRYALAYYCSGGGSLGGTYLKTEITPEAMGILRRGQTFADLLHQVPMAQMELTRTLGEFAEDLYDDYEVMTMEGLRLFTITPQRPNDRSAAIDRILIHSPLYRTAKGINCHSTLGDIRRAYTIGRAEPTETEVVLHVDELHAQFAFSKESLPKTWWHEAEQRVDLSQLPDSLRPTSFILWWAKE